MSIVTDKASELVLCVQSSAVRDLFGGRTWLPIDEATIDARLPAVTKAFLPRSIAETAIEWRHLATYCVITSGDMVFAYRRGKSGSEGRLHGRLSLGVGGHVDIGDFADRFEYTENMLANAGLREIDEELHVPSGSDMRVVGLIADDSTPVNAVHLGVVFRIELDHPKISVLEDCLAEPAWLTLDELASASSEMETWSRILLDNLFSGAPS